MSITEKVRQSTDADVARLAARVVELEGHLEIARAACDDALNTLIGCCIPAGGCDDRTTILNAQLHLRKVLNQTSPTLVRA